jgi:tetratricopeptide (TPR) repeat protein
MVGMARASTIGTVAILLSAAGFAQQYGSADDLATFALALNGERLSDLGKDVVKKAIDSGVQDPQGQLASALCEISATEAMRTVDVTQRITKLKEAVGAYEGYLKQFSSGEKAAIARLKLSEWLRTAGETCAAQIKKESDSAKKEALKSDGLNFFTKAEVLSKTRIDDIARLLKDKVTDEQKELLQNELFALKFAVARMPYSKALLYENRDGVEAQQLLNEAQTLLDELDLDLPAGSILSFEARRIIALIQVEQKKLKDAEETLEYSCNTLADAVTQAPEIVKDFPDNWATRDLIARMFLEKAEFLTRTKKPADWKGALDTTEKLVKLIPDVVKTKDGKQAMIIMAEAMAEEGHTAKAGAVAQQVYDADPSGDAGLKARDLLDKLGPGGGGSDLASMVKLLAGTVERGDIAQGERMASKILGNPELRSKPEIKADALMQLGGLYYNKGFYSYAAVAFAAVAEEFPTSPKAPEAKFNEAMSHARQSALEGRSRFAKFWKEKSKAARSELVTKFPNSKEAQDVSWFVAADLMAEEKFPEAADAYLKVSSTSPKYGEAQHEGGALVFDLGVQARTRDKKDEVVKHFSRAEAAYKNAATAFETTLKTAINPAEISKLKDSIFIVRLRLAGLYIQTEMKKADEAERVLKETEVAVKDDKAKLGKVWSLRIKALSQLGRGKEAIAILKDNKELATAETFVMVAAQVDAEQREKFKTNEKDPEVVELRKQAAELYGLAVDKAGSGQKVDWTLVGQRLLLLGAALSGSTDDLSLIAIDPAVPMSEKATIERARKAFEFGGAPADLDIDRQRAIAFASAATGNWLDAVASLKEVADKLPLFKDRTKLNKEVMQDPKNSRLPDLYQDLAVAYIRAAKGEKAHCMSAIEIVTPLILNSDPKSKRYWEARYLHLLALKEAKEFGELDSHLDGLARTAPDADGGKYGIKAKIDEIRAFRDKRIVNK